MKLIAITNVILSNDFTFQVRLKVELSETVLILYPKGTGAGYT